jgi:serine-type D-Ala-D-Ala carboxypeptidase (penicillin-binding protein 5/6)
MRIIFVSILLIILAGASVFLPPPKNGKPLFLKDFSSAGGYNFFNKFLNNDKDADSINPYENLELQARSAVVLDLNQNKIIFDKNSNLSWPLASLAKLAVAAVASKAIDESDSARRQAIITAEAIAEEGDDGFAAGESFDAADLRDAMLVKSSNDAASALALWVRNLDPKKRDASWFINEMNLLVSNLGLQKTYFLNNTGLDFNKDLAGASGTAGEFAKFFAWLLKTRSDMLLVTSGPKLIVVSQKGITHIFESSAKALMHIPGLIAVKTGYTDLAGGNLAFAFNLGPARQFVVVILGSSFDGRFEDAVKIYEATKIWAQL